MSRSERQNPWRAALDQALTQLAQAEHAFEWAEAEFTDYHAYRIQAAKEQVALILRQARQAYGVHSVDRMLKEAQAHSALTSGEFAQSRW
jgi:hypothetical protein